MSYYSQHGDTEPDGFAGSQSFSPDFLSPTAAFVLSPNIDEPMDTLLMFGNGPNVTSSISPSLSPLEVGSAPNSIPLLDHQNSFVQDGLYFTNMSHSYPDYHQYGRPAPIGGSYGAIQEQEDDAWIGHVFMREEDPSPYSFQPPPHQSIASSCTTEEIDLHHVPKGWSSSATAMARTESAFSHTSVGSRYSANSFEDFRTDDVMMADCDVKTFQSSPLMTPTEIVVELTDDAATPKSIPTTKNPGRKGKLTPKQREHAAYIRKIGACNLCRMRRARCDGGIPCSACKRYYRNDLEELDKNPCRGEQLKELADIILNNNAFPKGPYQRFLSKSDFSIEQSDLRIFLDLGIGNYPFECRIRLVRAKPKSGEKSPFVHNHVEYPWPPAAGVSFKHNREDVVFPAILADNDDAIAAQVEAHLAKILENRNHFQFFPVWASSLKVLRIFYKYFLGLPRRSRNPLKQAFQLLILVHVGGDLRLWKDDPMVTQLNNKFFPKIPHEHILPCLIRAQLGPIFSTVAHRLMSDVLKQLEKLSSLPDPAHFPMVIATFSVLFMSLESLQYHFAKVAFHSHVDSPTQSRDTTPPTRNMADFDGADILLRFYRSTSCHEQLKTLVDLPPALNLSNGTRFRSRSRSNSSSYARFCPAAENHGATAFLADLVRALRAAGPYLEQKDAMNPVVPSSDMSCFFDRLLAKMYRAPVEDP
jgi:hypothetical protein